MVRQSHRLEYKKEGTQDKSLDLPPSSPVDWLQTCRTRPGDAIMMIYDIQPQEARHADNSVHQIASDPTSLKEAPKNEPGVPLFRA